MNRSLLVMKQWDYTPFDSERYEEIYNYKMPDIEGVSSSGIQLCKEHAQEVVNHMENTGVKELVLVADNRLYSILSLYVVLFAEKIGYLEDLKIYILPEYYMDKCKKESVFIESVYEEIDWKKPRLEQYQVHLTDKCNLNCKGCGHYCSIATEANLLDADKYERDIQRIKDKFWGVERLYLLGGEPLLHPDVNAIMEKTRAVFPDSDIRLSTNGLLLPKQGEKFFDAVKQYNVHIEISLYQPTLKLLKEGLEELLKDKGVWETTILQGPRDLFFKQKLLKENKNPEKAFLNCVSNRCYFLRNGYLSVCPGVYLNNIFCEKFGLEQQFEPDGIDLYDDSISGWEINERLSKPSSACAYCSFKPVFFKWEASSAERARLEDWVVGMENAYN